MKITEYERMMIVQVATIASFDSRGGSKLPRNCGGVFVQLSSILHGCEGIYSDFLDNNKLTMRIVASLCRKGLLGRPIKKTDATYVWLTQEGADAYSLLEWSI